MFLNECTLKFHLILHLRRYLYGKNVHSKVKYNLEELRKNKSMANNSNLLKPPQRVAGLTTLNKALFEKHITVPCLTIKDAKVSAVLPIIKKYLLKIDNFKPVKVISEQETRVYLNPQVINNWKDLPGEAQESLEMLSLNETNLQNNSHILNYENFSLDSILKAVLPSDIEGLSSFTKVGHIVHVNLREHLLPYKNLIGQVLFDKVANCRTVVNKAAVIDNTYRNFKMELLRGEDDFRVQLKENKCIFEFDFSKVYWNSRLCTEHERIVNMIKTGDVVFDVFAGVGPFSVPLAKKKCRVFANDLNPESYKWLNHNVEKNKVDKNYFKSYNKDGKEFILEEIKELLPKYLNKNRIYILMNLPAMAVEFLSAFVNLCQDVEVQVPPTVVLYCFAKGEDYESIAKNLLFQKLGFTIDDKIIDIFRVRTVSSLKEMMRITFKLDSEILAKIKTHKRKHTLDGKSERELKKCICVAWQVIISLVTLLLSGCNGEEQDRQRLQGRWSEGLQIEDQSESCEN
jgi:tRNA (guanine37-N1)-methyltransferase